jgi:hypothetical protein
MTEIMSISIPPESRKLVEEVMKMKPDGTSFSKALRLIIEDYLRNKSSPIFHTKQTSITISDKIEDWKKEINGMDVEDFIKTQKKMAQINYLINKRVEKCLR